MTKRHIIYVIHILDYPCASRSVMVKETVMGMSCSSLPGLCEQYLTLVALRRSLNSIFLRKPTKYTRFSIFTLKITIYYYSIRILKDLWTFHFLLQRSRSRITHVSKLSHYCLFIKRSGLIFRSKSGRISIPTFPN